MYLHIQSFSANLGDNMKDKKLKIITTGTIVLAIIISLKFYNDYREKSLNSALHYKPNDFYSLGVLMDLRKVPQDRAYEWFTLDQEPADELFEFLSQYRVKKISEDEFNEYLNKGDKFEFTINHGKAKPLMVWILDGHIQSFVGKHYEIVNGPVDMAWIRDFHEKNKEIYGE